jgi:hypothetical protein
MEEEKKPPYHRYAMQFIEDLFKRNGLKVWQFVGVGQVYWLGVKRGDVRYPMTESLAAKIINAANGAIAMSDLVEDHYPIDYSAVLQDKELWRSMNRGEVTYEQK